MNIWIDLDKTIWNCHSNSLSSIWAKDVVGLLTLNKHDSNIIHDDLGNTCVLDEHFKNFCQIYHNSVNLNFISAGALPKIPWNEQPSIKLLKLFDIYQYFSNKILDYKTLKKGLVLSSLTDKDCILVDDDESQLSFAKNLGIKTINRNTFNSWKVFPNLLV